MIKILKKATAAKVVLTGTGLSSQQTPRKLIEEPKQI
jgi:uncharacterized protein